MENQQTTQGYPTQQTESVHQYQDTAPCGYTPGHSQPNYQPQLSSSINPQYTLQQQPNVTMKGLPPNQSYIIPYTQPSQIPCQQPPMLHQNVQIPSAQINYVPATTSSFNSTINNKAANSTISADNYSSTDSSSTDNEAEATPNANPWQRVAGHKRKRSRIIEPKNNNSQFAHSNMFSVLESQDNGDSNAINPNIQAEKTIKPPPIFVHGVMDYGKMRLALTEVAEAEQYTTKSLANNIVKLNANTPETYRKLIKFMKDSGIIHHTYQLKEDKAYRVVLRNLHPTVPVEEIKSTIQKEGFQVRAITNIRHRISKDPLPLFYVDLEPAPNNKDIYSLKFINNQVIKVEPPRKNNSIVQCTRCQMYNHTKTYCTLPFACVKCGGQHDTKTCKKDPALPAKCALCGGNHTANYRGCDIYQKLQQKLGREYQPKERTTQQHGITQQIIEPTNLTYQPQHYPRRSYSQIVSQESKTQQQDENLTLSKFLDEFKTMFNQLIQQNNLIINMLSTVINKLIH